MKRGHGKAHVNPEKRAETNALPLRRVLGETVIPIEGTTYTMGVEMLECGHYQHPRQDIIGRTNAVRRRCRKCGKGAPQDFTPND